MGKTTESGWMCRVLVSVLAVTGLQARAAGKISAGTVTPDGTNVWIGAATGGSMADAANWRAESPAGYTVEELFKLHCVYDLRGLADGAVLENDLTTGNTYANETSYNTSVYNLVAGIIADGAPSDTWRIKKTTGKGLFFTKPCYLDVAAGNLVWEDSAGDMYPYKVPTKRGQGTFWFQTVPTFWESEGIVSEGTLGFTNGVSTVTYRWRVKAGAKIEVAPSGVTSIAQVLSDATDNPDTQIKVRTDAVLSLSTGFNNYSSGNKWYGDLVGDGTLRVTGGGTHYFAKKAVETLSFTGTYQPVLGMLQLGTDAAPLGLNPAASIDVVGSGWARLYTDATIANLTGTGSDGGVLYPAANTLTVDGGAATNVYSGRLAGGAFVKKGADHTLVLTGETRHSGQMKVESGTLAVQRGFNRPDLRAYWSFDDASDMGRDDAPDGLLSALVRKDPTYRPSLVDDGVSGRAVRFGDPSSMANGGAFFRARKEDVSLRSALPRGAAPFTFSFWMRPRKGMCGNGTNFILVDAGSGTVTNESGEVSAGVAWASGGFFFGSSRWDEDAGSKASGLPAFKNLAFYCGTGWTRGGIWNDAGGSVLYSNKVAIAKFDDANYLFDGNWHHVVGTYSNRIIRIFVDGVLKDERTRPADLDLSANPYLQFGNYASGDSGHAYQGDLDEIQWFAGAWSEADVAAEYAAKNPRRHAAPLLPTPAAHWTFDAQMSDKGYADVTGHGFDLENVASNGTLFVAQEDVTYADDSSFAGAAARITAKTSYLKLKDGADLSTALTNGASFTLSLRCGYPGDGSFFMLGDGTDANTLYLGDSGCPRVQFWKVGSSSYAYSDSGTYGTSGSMPQTAYCFDTLVYDAVNKHLRIYRDGVLHRAATGVSFTLKPTQLQWGSVNSKTFVNLRLDDMRFYNVALTGGQVAELARQIRRGADSGADTKVLPADAAVEVAAGATFATLGANDFAIGTVTGAGTVDIHGGTSFKAADYTGFSGALAGAGFLSVDGSATVPSAVTVTADIRIDNPTVPVAAAGGQTPYAETSGRVVVPASGTLTVAGATQPGQLAGKRWPLAKGASVVVPSDLSGWTVSPQPAAAWEFKTVDGVLYFAVGGGGSIIIVR
ncbi:MAG: LamG-like jellyroll fold domain-containing protein [Kiritimatiellia bacterium]